MSDLSLKLDQCGISRGIKLIGDRNNLSRKSIKTCICNAIIMMLILPNGLHCTLYSSTFYVLSIVNLSTILRRFEKDHKQ